MKRSLIAALLASTVLIAPASATVVLDTFNGTVVASDGQGNVTTNDIGNYFGGGSLLNDAFTLNFYISAGAVSSFTGTEPGGYPIYSPPNLMTADLTINGQTFSFVTNSTYPLAGAGSTGNMAETRLQNFYWSAAHGGVQTQGVVLDFTPLIATPADFSGPLPTMLANQLMMLGGAFYDQNGETLTLNVSSVGTVPEPSTWVMMALGFFSLAFAFRSRRRVTSLA